MGQWVKSLERNQSYRKDINAKNKTKVYDIIAVGDMFGKNEVQME